MSAPTIAPAGGRTRGAPPQLASASGDRRRRKAGVPLPFWRGPRPRPGSFAAGHLAFAFAMLVIGVYIGAFVWQLSSTDYNVIGVLWVLPALLVGSAPIVRRVIRKQADPWIGRVIVVAFLIKVVASFANYLVLYVVYNGVADANGYDTLGQQLYAEWRSGHFDLKPIAHLGGDSSLTFARVATGVVYYVVGPSKLAGYVVFSVAAFCGLYFFLRAFQTAFPNGAHRRYSVLILLFPSVVFWTSGIGKEAWMVLALGLFSLGAARVFTHRRAGFAMLSAALGGIALVRAHVALIALLAITAGYFVRRSSRRTPLSSFGKVFGLGALVLLGGLAAYKFQTQFGVHSISGGSLGTVLNRASKGSDNGQATFSGSITPLSVSVLLFRPFPWEATSFTSLISAAEGLTLLVALVVSRRRVVTAFRLAFKEPYVMFCGAYVAIFCVAFATISNFGTLARERTQVLPFVFVLLSLPLAPKRRRQPSIARRRRPPRGIGRRRAVPESQSLPMVQ